SHYLREGPAQGRRYADVLAEIQEERGRAVCRQGAGKGPHHADRASPLKAHRSDLSVDRAIDWDGQPLLFLWRRRRLRAVLSEVLLVFSLQRQALRQRA